LERQAARKKEEAVHAKYANYANALLNRVNHPLQVITAVSVSGLTRPSQIITAKSVYPK
jgi:hypothetical protein